MDSLAFLPDLITLRKCLHQKAELSNMEVETSKIVHDYIVSKGRPDESLTGIGGHGLAFIYSGEKPGPTIAFRAELDAVPIDELLDLPHRSETAGVSHKCGHDGHMAILCGLSRWLAEHRPPAGRVVLFFQPAEETGEGARRMLADSRFARIRPDHCFALHNLPGFAAGEVVIRDDTFSCASVGLRIELRGMTSHAAHPERGRSPVPATKELLTALAGLQVVPDTDPDFSLATVVHVNIGEPAFGSAPGSATIMLTLRAQSDKRLALLLQEISSLVRKSCRLHSIESDIRRCDRFAASKNDSESVKLVKIAAQKSGLATRTLAAPFRWSEDFGLITRSFRGALFGLGAGLAQPELHRADYEFPDELIETGVRLLAELAETALRNKAGKTTIATSLSE